MNTATNPLAAPHPGDTLDHVRDVLAVVAAAVACPYEERPPRSEVGLIKLLIWADDALDTLAPQSADPEEETADAAEVAP